MKTKILLVLFVILFAFKVFARIDEGMWLPLLLGKNYEEMQRLGLKLTPEQLYSINNSSLKDAIVMLDGGSCSGVIVSSEGLLLTNHHCGYEEIQEHSSVEHDYLTNGFWAKTKEEELPNEGKTVTFLIRIEDVTNRIISAIPSDASEPIRENAIDSVINVIEKDAKKGSHYEVEVKSFFEGNEFYLFVYETFLDVRLVGAPPETIGKFGGDTDNWMWPRHTGDFAFFRVYTAPDGTPAKYSKDNIPLKPKSYLPISIKGIKENDFAMVWGIPGNTERYLSSYGVKLALEQVNPGIIKIREKKLEIMKEEMNKSPQVRIQYSSKYAQCSNYWKYFIGQNKGLKRLKIIDKKEALENEFQKWVNQDPKRKEKYGNVIKDFEECYEEITNKKYQLTFWYFNEILIGAEILWFAYKANELQGILEQGGDIKEAVEEFRKEAKKHFKDYNVNIDKKIFSATLQMFYQDIPENFHPSFFLEVMKKYKGNFDKYAEYVFSKSIFASEEKINTFLANPNAKTLEKDPAYIAISSFLFSYYHLNFTQRSVEAKLDKAKRLFIEGLRQMYPDKKFYPDANSTMRMTFGTVKDYFPADAVHYDYLTYLDGIMEKEDPDNPEFIVPEKLKQLYKAKDYGIYGVNGKMPVCFLTNNDITGGNSGSPVINGDGELIGLAFDGNWEAMSGDIVYEPQLQRCICVDIRYVLFITDKFAGAKNLINEMKIVMN